MECRQFIATAGTLVSAGLVGKTFASEIQEDKKPKLIPPLRPGMAASLECDSISEVRREVKKCEDKGHTLLATHTPFITGWACCECDLHIYHQSVDSKDIRKITYPSTEAWKEEIYACHKKSHNIGEYNDPKNLKVGYACIHCSKSMMIKLSTIRSEIEEGKTDPDILVKLIADIHRIHYKIVKT